MMTGWGPLRVPWPRGPVSRASRQTLADRFAPFQPTMSSNAHEKSAREPPIRDHAAAQPARRPDQTSRTSRDEPRVSLATRTESLPTLLGTSLECHVRVVAARCGNDCHRAQGQLRKERFYSIPLVNVQPLSDKPSLTPHCTRCLNSQRHLSRRSKKRTRPTTPAGGLVLFGLGR